MSGWGQGLNSWDNRRKVRFRAQVLDVIASRHARQQSRMNDRELKFVLSCAAVDCQIDDVVTILQDLQGRNYVRFVQINDRNVGRTMLEEIEILPAGQDLVDGTTTDPAVKF